MEQRSLFSLTILLLASAQVGSTTPPAIVLIYCPNICMEAYHYWHIFKLTYSAFGNAAGGAQSKKGHDFLLSFSVFGKWMVYVECLCSQEECANFIRLIEPWNRTQMYICGTGAYNPVCTFVNRGRKPQVRK